ncbi:MAG: PhzF family phenazine biosynthesis protein [Gammaproteobacteria bacterium]|nr:PhzF family phenazine biosynthesis protein [Gammaproteobacteria bacterium]
MIRRCPFEQVDVFTAKLFAGNPVAVVLDADELSSEQMQAIARWTNLSETTFVCSPHAAGDYRLRIFTPRGELPFAGHPTIGSAHAFLRRRGRSTRVPAKLLQECGKGLVSLRVEDDGRIFLELPSATHRQPTPQQIGAAAEALGVASADIGMAVIVDVGAVWFTLQLADAASVVALRPDMTKIAALQPPGLTGVTVFGSHPRGGSADVEVRSFAPAHGVNEDPVCGSGNGCVASVLRNDPNWPAGRGDYVASQGTCVMRDGRVHVRYEGESIWLGGHAVTCVEGMLNV